MQPFLTPAHIDQLARLSAAPGGEMPAGALDGRLTRTLERAGLIELLGNRYRILPAAARALPPPVPPPGVPRILA